MAVTLNVYAPNVSKQHLEELTLLQLGDAAGEVQFERLERVVQFRAPEVAMHLSDESDAFKCLVLEALLSAARLLGGSQFTIWNDGFEMRERPTDIPQQQLQHLIIACLPYTIQQINIY